MMDGGEALRQKSVYKAVASACFTTSTFHFTYAELAACHHLCGYY